MKASTVAATIVTSIGVIYFGWFMYSYGAQSGELALAEYKESQRIEIERVESEHKQRLDEAKSNIAVLEKKITDGKAEYEKATDARITEYTGRLRDSEKRAGVYLTRARGSEADREYLSAHATKLDQALEDGRLLVGQLKDTLELRESQLRLIGIWFDEHGQLYGR